MCDKRRNQGWHHLTQSCIVNCLSVRCSFLQCLTHALVFLPQLPALSVDVHDESLCRQMSLSTADLRFADYLVKSVCDDRFVAQADREMYADAGIQGAR